ncbi:hypothetical protein [Streptomyces pseudovenezuelae]|uniref:hypothetical protein n=1 Tax=Streptomyces pseudovenezuelae TaxID=67350 RepID=UPI002E7FEC7A|nr:hypothetical protein [Streptomyces pseudovenezuelae]WUA94485.1 hypothetical protein OHO81_44735 [Streptomyces pseudovenezuelae]
MRHATTIAATAVLLCALTACGSSGGDGDSKPAAASHSPSPSVDPATAYLATAQGIAFTGTQPTDAELTTLPPQWCTGLNDGHSVEWLFSSGGGALYPNGMNWGTVKKDAYQLVAAGVKAYCPKYLDSVTAELRATGEY